MGVSAVLDERTRLERIGALCGSAVREVVEPAGGYTPAWRRRVRLADGRRLFAKGATSPRTAADLAAEMRLYEAVRAPWLPEPVALEDGLLLLPDLGDARWPPPWQPGDVEAVRATLAQVAATEPPPGLPPVARLGPMLRGWEALHADPEPFLRLFLCTERWWSGHGDALSEAAGVELAGDALLHFDVRSDNLCLRDGQVVLVDWNHACRGPAELDVAFWLPSLHDEGGPAPWEVLPGRGDLAALVAGFYLAQAGKPPLPHAPAVRGAQFRFGAAALGWAVRALGLPDPLGAAGCFGGMGRP